MGLTLQGGLFKLLEEKKAPQRGVCPVIKGEGEPWAAPSHSIPGLCDPKHADRGPQQRALEHFLHLRLGYGEESESDLHLGDPLPFSR